MVKPQNIIAQIYKNIKKKHWKCLVDNCNNIAINSHLIQRNGLLNNISDKGHLIEVKLLDAYKWHSNTPPLKFNIVGIRNALTFKIFCNNHDTKIFKPIESENNDFNTYISFLLFSYRTVCAEIHKKMEVIETYTRYINSSNLNSIINKETLYSLINGNKLGIVDLQIMKKKLENEIENQKANYTYYAFKYDRIDVYASAVFSATSIEFPKEKGAIDLENIYIHILPLKAKTLILIGYHNDYTNNEIIEYCKSWKKLDKTQLEIKLTSLFINNIENWGVSPNLYNKIKESNKVKYINMYIENIKKFGLTKTESFNLFE